mmetsp:Transcript_10281/g.22878  ORF Transcript_10281/g.22878 Transcript_10281/m.22878 type:complete len:120 (-) Transcript_10281:162-521(-)|eukprot:CAMPEP_0172305766 /NCGR_PEP_ID=MMETSP1058-20130122/7003_1 /TAXON_ID=83371 /ORGANISM="Detonula confervacea, Strain CCMP 353" /LENGTH=119 /DNA_ID=CAMNT_0013017473 /DNA_START=64 /DNA_END=423 /DNA_ORIENTATION=-
MKSQTFAFLIAALVGQQSEAFQTAPFSRKAFLSKVATTTGALVATGALYPNSALAAPKQKAEKKAAFRGGKEMSDALHNGTDLNKGQAAMASGLLDKMGLVDITPDKGTNTRAAPRERR